MLKKLLISLFILNTYFILQISAADKEVWDNADKAVFKAFLSKHCYDCHDSDIQKGGIDLESMNFSLSSRDMLYKWSRVHEMIELGDMPPKKKTKPTPKSKEQALYALSNALIKADKTVPGKMEKRLGNKEIEYVLQDVFGTYINTARLLPDAEGTSGFDNQTVDLRISTDFMLKYNDKIDEFLEEFFSPQKPQRSSYTSSKIQLKEIENKVKITQGGIYRLTTLFSAGHKHENSKVFVSRTSDPMDKSQPRMADLKQTQKLVFESLMYAGDSYSYKTIPSFPSIHAKAYLLEGPIGKLQKFQQLSGCDSGVKMKMNNGIRLLKQVLPLLYCRNTKNEILKYTQEISRYKLSPQDAAKKIIKRALLSVEFLYGVDIKKEKKLTNIAIAKRMARLFWRSIPDIELLKLAIQKKLSDPQVRREQSIRMMKDQRFSRFKKDFFTFWLETRKFYTKENPTKDAFPKLYQQGEAWVLYSLYEQLNLYINDLVDNNRSIVELVASNWTYANNVINENYKLGLKGLDSNFKRVTIPGKSIRGGILTQGALMRLTSSINDTSPVKRGVWILENILGVEIPTPPPVNGFEPNIVGAKSIKEQFMMHREHKSCASCHEKIDPIGFLFEVLGPLGEERTTYPVLNNSQSKAAKIDRDVMEFDGVKLSNINDFKKYISSNAKSTIAKSYMDKLAIYAFGRPKDFSDKLEINKILDSNPNFNVRDLIRDFVVSPIFIK